MAFLLYMIFLISNFIILALVIGSAFTLSGASQKVVSLMQSKPKINSKGGKIIPENQCLGTIELQNITFEYPTKQDVKILDNFSLKVEQNQVVALVGHSGCGKSTVISLIERFYEPSA